MTMTATSGAFARRISLAALCIVTVLAAVACAAESAADPGSTPPVTLAVRISPRTMSIVTGGSQQFAAVVDSAGHEVARSLSWGATGGVIDQAGRFVAGGNAGQARVWATASGATADTILGQVTVVPPVPVASVSVSLASTSVVSGGTTTATATPRDAAGAALSGRGVTWRSSNTGVATVNASGNVTAVAAGTSTIRATVEGVDGTATLTVTTPPPVPVASVSVALNSASLTVGQTTQATPTMRDPGNNVLTGRAVTWGSSNTSVATVNGSGLVTAVGAGNANITATSEGRSGSAPLTVTAPPTGGAGPDTVFVDRFESGTLSLWQDGVDPARHRVVTTQPHGGTRALEITTANGDGGWLTRFFMPGYDSVYVSFWVRYGSDWTAGSKLLSLRGSRIDNQWSGFGNAGRCPTGTDFFSGNVVTDGAGAPPAPGPLRLYTYYPGMPSSGGSCWGDLGLGRGASYADVAGGPVALAPATQWHRVEYFFRLNTPGQTNSEQYVWVDGRRVATWTGIAIRTTTDLRLNSVQFNISGATGTQHVYFDDIVVLRGRPSGLP